LVGEVTKRKRPTGVTVIAILLILSAVFFLFTFPRSPSFLLIYYPILLLVEVIAAIGLLMLKDWGRKLTLIVIWLGLIGGVIISSYLVTMTQTTTPFTIGAYYEVILMSAIMALITVIFTGYFRKDHVRIAFKD
jgi:hypothetical protein